MFNCQLTGKCCQVRSGHETIILPEDASLISKELDLSMEEFFCKYCKVVAYRWDSGQNVKFSALKNTDKACVLLKKNKCSVHHSKPFVCKVGPIIPPLFDGLNFDSWFSVNCLGAIEANNKKLHSSYTRNKHELEKRFNEYYEEYFKKKSSDFWINLVKSNPTINQHTGD